MPTININRQNFNEQTKRPGIVLVDVWANWCGPCKQFTPIYEKVSEKEEEHTFTKLDVMEDKEFIQELGIENIPTLMIYRDGNLIYKEAGSPPESALLELIKKAEELDMDEVRARRNDWST